MQKLTNQIFKFYGIEIGTSYGKHIGKHFAEYGFLFGRVTGIEKYIKQLHVVGNKKAITGYCKRFAIVSS
jgi:hypothetical protein